MKIILSILLITSAIYSQDIVSLKIGNQWYYKYSYSETSSSNFTSQNYFLKKEVIGDSLLSGRDYKIIRVIKTENGISSFVRYEFWYCDSLEFIQQGNPLLYAFPKLFDLRFSNDSIGVDYYNGFKYISIFGENVLAQEFLYQQTGMADITTAVSTAQNIGVTNISQNGHIDTAELDYSYDINLIGAYIDGKEMGNLTSVADKRKNYPNNFVLKQNYPNPFNPSTTIEYSLPQSGIVQLAVYNILGEKIIRLVNEIQKMGTYKINFNASSLASGIYYYQIKYQKTIQTKKMLLIK